MPDENSKCTDDEYPVLKKVEQFRNNLRALNDLYRELLANNVYVHFYLGPNHIYTYLPTDAKFERINKEQW